MKSRDRRPGKTPPIIFVIMAGIALVIVIVALALGGAGNEPLTPPGDRSAPIFAHERTIAALQQNSPQDLYEEFSPSMKELVFLDELIAAENAADTSFGQVLKVQVIQQPIILTGPEWNSEWAEAKVRVSREQITQDYIVRYVLEEGQWWLFITIPE